jgi:glycosyltransferase involved in cell wall biosynthesis
MAWSKVFKSADKVITESKSLQNLISEMTNSYKNLSYIYNPHFEKQDEFKIKSKNMNEFGNYIMGLGRLTKQKNFRLLITAFSKINFIKDTKLVIVGDGEEKKYLNKLVQKLDKESPNKKLSSKIIFTGELDEPLSYIKNAKMIVIPSLWEGLPRVAIEAQALKTPIISSCREGGLGEILLDGNAGILTIPNDENDLIDAINLYEKNESLALRHAQEGFENIDRFSLKSSSKKYLKVFSEL